MPAMTFPSFLRFALAGLLLMAAMATRAADLEAWIDMEVRDGMLLATPKVKVRSTQTLSYELSAQKKGAAGTSSTRQAGTQTVKCCEPASLATLRLNVAPEDACTLSLTIRVEDRVVARVERECGSGKP
jgi:Thin aggregative fimbriae synthesis protein